MSITVDQKPRGTNKDVRRRKITFAVACKNHRLVYFDRQPRKRTSTAQQTSIIGDSSFNKLIMILRVLDDIMPGTELIYLYPNYFRIFA